MSRSSQVKIEELSESETAKVEEKSKSSTRKRPPAKSDIQLKDRLAGMLDRIVESLEARGDGELANAIREDSVVISSALVSLTRPFKGLRTLVLAVVAIIEPALAFGRIARIFMIRWTERRHERAQNREDVTHGSE